MEPYVDPTKADEITAALARFLNREVEIPFDLHADVTTIVIAARLYSSHLQRLQMESEVADRGGDLDWGGHR